MLNKFKQGLRARREEERKAELYRKLLRHEAKIGGEVFGDVPAGVRREFFCLDKNTWVWHEEWVDQDGQSRFMTTRYDVRPSGVVKSQNGHYSSVDKKEARNLLKAAKQYQSRVNQELYSFVAQ